MDIHRGDRFTTLVAMDTESFFGKDFVEKKTGKECKDFRNGDHTTTLMRTAKGKVVEIQHNVMTPQPYNRLFKLTGTKGYATKYPTPEYALSGDALKGTDAPQMDNLNAHGFMNAAQKQALEKKYYHPILTKYGEKGREMGHGGMDYLVCRAFVEAIKRGTKPPIDVYDAAAYGTQVLNPETGEMEDALPVIELTGNGKEFISAGTYFDDEARIRYQGSEYRGGIIPLLKDGKKQTEHAGHLHERTA